MLPPTIKWRTSETLQAVDSELEITDQITHASGELNLYAISMTGSVRSPELGDERLPNAEQEETTKSNVVADRSYNYALMSSHCSLCPSSPFLNLPTAWSDAVTRRHSRYYDNTATTDRPALEL